MIYDYIEISVKKGMVPAWGSDANYDGKKISYVCYDFLSFIFAFLSNYWLKHLLNWFWRSSATFIFTNHCFCCFLKAFIFELLFIHCYPLNFFHVSYNWVSSFFFSKILNFIFLKTTVVYPIWTSCKSGT